SAVFHERMLDPVEDQLVIVRDHYLQHSLSVDGRSVRVIQPFVRGGGALRPRGSGRGAMRPRALRVLLADPDAATRAEVRRLLVDDGRFVVCIEVDDAAAAVAGALALRPDLCLLEVDMPGGGLAAAWEITSRLPAVDVVVLTTSERD